MFVPIVDSNSSPTIVCKPCPKDDSFSTALATDAGNCQLLPHESGAVQEDVGAGV